jgi:hypothetical protein
MLGVSRIVFLEYRAENRFMERISMNSFREEIYDGL